MQFLFLRFSSVLLLGSVLFLGSCKKDDGEEDNDLQGNWITEQFFFEGAARSEAVTFTIGDKVYVSTGTSDRERFKDLWEFDINTNTWTQKQDFPGVARSSAVAFTVNGKGYVGTGYDGVNRLKDFYEYDPTTTTGWDINKRFELPVEEGRYDAVAFTINNIGYVGTGFDSRYVSDLWQFDPQNYTFIKKSSPLKKRAGAMVFVLKGKAYLCSGLDNGNVSSDLLVYNPADNSWTTKRKISNVSDEDYDDDYTTIMRNNGVAFVIGEKAYITAGENGSLNNTTWEYNADDDIWTQKTALDGSGRLGALAFSIKNRGFILTGRNGSLSFDNMFEFKPQDENKDND